MFKAKKQTHKPGTAKRLVRGSLVLSRTRALSAKLLRFFESGAASPLLKSVKKIDHLARNKVSSPLTKKMGLRKNFSVPVRNSIAAFFSRNSFMKKIASFRAALLNASIRSVGVFLLTFSVYGVASFVLKRFVASPLGVADPDDLAASAVIFLAGLLITVFGDKTVISSLGSSRITGRLLSGCLGVNNSSFERYKTSSAGKYAFAGFGLGSVLGVMTLFLSPLSILLNFFSLLFVVAIMHIPELGLLSVVATISFLPIGILTLVISVTFASFVVKYIRLKRNFRFGTADVVVLMIFLAMIFHFSLTSGDISSSEGYIIAFFSIYFLSKNLLNSETLVVQTFNALCSGLSVGMVLYILGEYAIYIPHENLRLASIEIASNVLDSDMLFMIIASVLPFALSSFSAASKKRPNTWFLVVALSCAVITDSFLSYALILVTVLVFVACATKSPGGAALAALITVPPVFLILSDFATSVSVSAMRAKMLDPVFNSSEKFISYWTASVNAVGLLATFLSAVALIFVFQRIFCSTVMNRSKRNVLLCGTVAASAVMTFVCSFLFNPFSDLRVVGAMWFIFGFCGAAYKVYYSSQPEITEE